MNMPIKKRLVFLSVMTIIIPLITLTSIFFIYAGKTIIRESTDRTMEKMILLDQSLTLYIEKIRHTVSTISNNPIVYGLDTRDIITYKYFPDWTDMNPQYNSQAEKEIYEYLKLIHLSNPDFGSVYLGTETGRFVMYPPSGRRPYYDPSKRPWFIEAKEQNGRITVTSPFQSSDTNYIIFAIAQYMYFIRSQEYGVVAVNIDLSSITKILSHFNMGLNSFVVLTKADNTIIANTKDPQINFKKLDSPSVPRFYGSLKTLEGEWQEVVTDDGVFLASKIPSVGKDWFLYTLIDKNDVIAPFKRIFYLMVLISGLILVIFIPLAAKFSIDSLIPLKKLSDHLAAVAQGNETLQKKIPLYSSDEIGTTIENFNLFLDALNSILTRVIDSEQTISSNNSKFSNQMLIASTDISKNSTSIDNMEKELHHAETCISNTVKAVNEIENLIESGGSCHHRC